MRDDKLGHAPLVSIITVTFNSAEHIRGCVASVSRSVGTMPIEHIVIDNASRTAPALWCEPSSPT